MIGYYLLLCLFGILTYFLTVTVANEAIVHGKIAQEGAFPYQVSVHVNGHDQVCGGGIVDNRFILTAAHCVINSDRHLYSKHISILAGTNNMNRNGPPAVTVRVETVFFPTEFHPTVHFSVGDIAVLKLVQSLRLEHHAHLGKLEFPRHYESGDEATIAGFGWNEYHKYHNERVGSTDGQLRYAQTNVISNPECEKYFPDGVIQSDKHLCASNIQPYPSIHFSSWLGVCTGDAGSPLVVNKTIVIGILSRIPNYCNELYGPAVYMRVTYYLGMIFNIMERGHDSSIISLHT